MLKSLQLVMVANGNNLIKQSQIFNRTERVFGAVWDRTRSKNRTPRHKAISSFALIFIFICRSVNQASRATWMGQSDSKRHPTDLYTCKSKIVVRKIRKRLDNSIGLFTAVTTSLENSKKCMLNTVLYFAQYWYYNLVTILLYTSFCNN